MAARRDQPVVIVVVRADDWMRLRSLRLRALLEDADAFATTFAAASAQPEEDWRQRAAQSDRGDEFRWFAAVNPAGDWVGMALAAARDNHGADSDQVSLFGMWVAPEARGGGVLEQLCDACVAWAADRGSAEVVLEVLTANRRAQHAYRRCGFHPTHRGHVEHSGRSFEVIEMRRPTAGVGR